MKKQRISLSGADNKDVTIWTVQPLIVWETLEKAVTLVVDPTLCVQLHDWRDSYEWMCQQMQMRLAGNTGRFPWWAWHRCSVRRPKPHLNYLRRHSGPPGTHVRIELRMPKEMVLLSSLPAWECVINRSYIAYTRQESNWWFEAEENAGLGSVSWPYPEPWRQRVEATWPRIFDLDGLEAGDEWSQSRIQATFEILDLQYVVDVDKYTAI